MRCTLNTFSPREVQSRVRAGATPEVVAAETGWPLDKVQRYADPPLAERAFIVQSAQGVRVPGGGATLAELTGQVLAALGIDELQWDAFRRLSDGRWVVTAEVSGSDSQAVWSYDPDGRNVHPQNDFARVLMGVADAADSAPSASAEELNAVEHPSHRDERPHLVAVHPESVEPEPNPRADTLTLDVPVPTSSPRRKPRSRRASVPSWDEILFGTQRDTDH